MGRIRNIRFKLYKLRASYRRTRRVYFPSPAEVEFMRIFGVKYVTKSWIKDPKTGYLYVRVKDKGLILSREFIEREVRVGAMYADFATVGLRYKKVLEIDGRDFHQDITKEQERDEYLAQYGYRVLHIQAADLYRNKDLVQRRVLNFLAS